MSSRLKLWLTTALFYIAFVFWYTDFGGALTDTEINNYVSIMGENGTKADTIAFIEGFMRSDTGKQFLMVNVIDYNENPPNVEGAEPGESADQLMARYMEHMLPALLKRGCHPVIFGDAVYKVMDKYGIEGADDWTHGAIFRYRSRRALMDIVSNPVFSGKHDYKHAALDKTLAYPIEPSIYLGDARLLLGLLLLSITAMLDAFWLSRKSA